MSQVIRDVLSGDSSPDMQAVKNDIAALRRDLATLVSQMSNSAVANTRKAAQSAADQVSAEANRVYDNVSTGAERSVKALSRTVDEQPVTALLVVFALGVLGSALFWRR